MVKCPECGKEIKESYNKCPFCGHEMSKKQTNGNKANNTNKIIAIVAIVVVIAIVGVFMSGMLGNNNSADNDSSASDDGTEYWASINGDKFHLPSCEWAKKISEDNKIIYHSREDAIADGKEPCGECNP